MQTSKPKTAGFSPRVAPIGQSQAGFPHKAFQLVAEAFDAVPTTFGRLVLAAYLLHRDTGIYVCPLASIAYGYEEVSLALGDTHRKLLSTWLAMTPDRQISDIQSYLSAVDDKSNVLAISMRSKRSYDSLLPIGVDANDRKNFMKTVGLALRKCTGTSQLTVSAGRA